MNISYLAMSDIPSKNANSLQIVQMCNAFIENGNKVNLVTPFFNHTENISIKNYYGIKNKINVVRIGKKRKELSKLDNIIFENTLLDNLKKDEIVNLDVEGKAYHEWAMKIMDFLQKNNFSNVQIRTLKK